METGAISHSKITVTVIDEAAAPLPGVIGLLSGSMIGERDEISNAKGQMVFRGLPPGTYQLTFSLDGFQPVRRQATIHEDQEADVMSLTMRLDEI